MKERNCAVLYMSYSERSVRLWLLKSNGNIHVRISAILNDDVLRAESVVNVEQIFRKSAVSFGIKPHENFEVRSSQGNETKDDERIFHLCHKMIIAPVVDLLTEPEIIIVSVRSSYRVPFPALRDGPAGECLSNTHWIRIVPSLMTLSVIQECSADYHSQTGALVVGDPMVGRVYSKHPHIRTHDFGGQADQVLIYRVLSEKSA